MFIDARGHATNQTRWMKMRKFEFFNLNHVMQNAREHMRTIPKQSWWVGSGQEQETQGGLGYVQSSQLCTPQSAVIRY